MPSATQIHVSPEEGLRQLQSRPNEFVELLAHGSLVGEYYKPNRIDRQQPHERDEVYVVTSGRGIFNYDGTRSAFKPGDLLFVPAGIDHRFEAFTDDFATWVLFYGPVGGEVSDKEA